ncbi:MAG TPA: S53 family peptidase, partial [Planctomycetaceae bacterium]|nr:S53 family peptidase [Planctomycetaceae bacterium]
ELGGGYVQADLDQFSQLNGLPPITVIDVSVNGGQNEPGGNADYEVGLDIEVAAAAYFYATGQMPVIKVFFAPNAEQSFADIVNAAVVAQCDVLSISWGAPEKNWNQAALTDLDALIANSGLTVFAASGDNSSSDGSFLKNVDAPSSLPHIVACGGTNKQASAETVWGNGRRHAEGTGGGYSRIFPTQAFQVGAPAGSGRMVPDLAATADPETGYEIVVHGEEVTVGGTSAVSPLYAGLFASFGKKLGFVTPTLWQNPSAFVDITKGDNGAYNATVGPDPCTGLGVPNGAAIGALFTGNAVFTVHAAGLQQSNGKFALPVNLPNSSRGLVTPLTGRSSTLPGNFAAVVVNVPTLSGKSSPAIFGVGGGLGMRGPDLYLFSGRK